MSPKQLALKMTESKEVFFLITGKPPHNDIIRICEALTPPLSSRRAMTRHMKNKNSGASSPPADSYTGKYGKAFATPEPIDAYPPISQDAINQTRKLKAVWKISIEDYSLFDTVVRGASAFILVVVDDVWIHKLRNHTIFYTDVLPSALIEHLEELCMVLYAIDTVDLLIIIQG